MSNFKDSSNIIIENDEPKYYYPGLSYLDKLKNGISLVYLFELENHLSTFKNEVSDSVKLADVECLRLNSNVELDSFDYDDIDITFSKKRKGKWNPLKKSVASNFKKNKIKQLGYSDKLFNLEQNTTVVEDEEDVEWYDDDSSCWSYSPRRRILHNIEEMIGSYW